MTILTRLASILFMLPVAVLAQKPDAPPLAPVPDTVTFAPAKPSLPAIFLVGDSTAEGYGPSFVTFFDPAKVNAIAAGEGGRSARTYINQGIWARVLKQVRPHDIVLFQMGHNDASAISDTNRCRGDLKGIGEETQEVDNPLTHQHEVVHTFGWYVRQYIHDVLHTAQPMGGRPHRSRRRRLRCLVGHGRQGRARTLRRHQQHHRRTLRRARPGKNNGALSRRRSPDACRLAALL
jgi:hypothetical protein